MDKLTYNETRKVRKLFFVWDFEREEDWLNSMARNGWALCGVSFGCYRFMKTEPGEYTVRVEMRGDDENYLNFMSSLNAEYVGRVFQWIFFRRKTELGEFDIFSDIDSRIDHLSRIATMLKVVGGANIIFGVFNSINPSRAGFINLLCACVLMYGLGRIRGKAEELMKQRELNEE